MISTSQLMTIKQEPAEDLIQMARPDVIRYYPRLPQPMPPNSYNFYPPHCVMPFSSYHIDSQPYFYHSNHDRLVMVPQLPNIPISPHSNISTSPHSNISTSPLSNTSSTQLVNSSSPPRLSPATATPATYGKRMCLTPPEAASIGGQRPFKVLTSPKVNPLPLIATLDPNTEAAYEEFKNQMMARVSNMSEQNNRNRNMTRNVPLNPEKLSDPEYLEKRRKNNEAAKKSRDARKSKEDEMAIRVAFLEKEVYTLMFKLAMLLKEKRNKLEKIKRPRLMPMPHH